MKHKSNIPRLRSYSRRSNLYERFHVDARTYAYYKTGPKFVKRNNIVLYKITDIDEWLTDKDEPKKQGSVERNQTV